MIRVTVTVRNERFQPDYDIEIPAETSTLELAPCIAEALNWRVDSSGRLLSHSIYAEPPGKVLAIANSLADAGVWDGATLTLEGFASAYFESANGAIYPLRRSQVFVSRHASVDATEIPDSVLDLSAEPNGQTVSRVHAVLVCRKGQWQIYHRSDTNQTFLNNQSLAREDMLALQEGDLIEFGGVVLTFHLGEPT